MILYAAADNLYRLDPVRFPTLHSLEKPPFYAVPPKAPDATVGGMPYGKALFLTFGTTRSSSSSTWPLTHAPPSTRI